MSLTGLPPCPDLPSDVIREILSHIPQVDAFLPAISCKSWYATFQCSENFEKFEFKCTDPKRFETQKLWLDLYLEAITTVVLDVDQSLKENRQNALEVIRCLAEAQNLTSLAVVFTGQNPLFYSGAEFSVELANLFRSLKATKLKRVDFGKMQILLNNDLLEALVPACKGSLKMLDLQNNQLVCKITQDVLLQTVRSCTKLMDLRVFGSCMSDAVICALADESRSPIRHLSLMCRRCDEVEARMTSRSTGNTSALTASAWHQLTAVNPDFSLTLKFDHTCTQSYVRAAMVPFLPVTTLHLETYTRIIDELKIAMERYCRTLRKVVLQTQASDELDDAVQQLVSRSPKLVSLHVMCLLKEETIEALLRTRPAIKRLEKYTLKSSPDAHPWVSDNVLDEILRQG